MSEESIHYLKENNYIVVKDFISKEMASYLYDYVKLSSNRLHWAKQNIPNVDVRTFGKFSDTTGSYDNYGDITFDTLLIHKLPIIEGMTGKKLIPTYSYFRLYMKDSELVKHIDRPSCEISSTLCLGYDTSNLDDTNWNWPMFVEGKPIHMKPGDMVVYRGCELEHWREPYIGLNHAQVFLHYNEVNGKYNNLNDGRPILGLPGNFKDFE